MVTIKVYKTFLSWYIINVWQGRYTWSVDLYVYNVQWYLIFVLQMGFCFLFGNLISFPMKELVYYLSYERLHTIVIFKIKKPTGLISVEFRYDRSKKRVQISVF